MHTVVCVYIHSIMYVCGTYIICNTCTHTCTPLCSYICIHFTNSSDSKLLVEYNFSSLVQQHETMLVRIVLVPWGHCLVQCTLETRTHMFSVNSFSLQVETNKIIILTLHYGQRNVSTYFISDLKARLQQNCWELWMSFRGEP